MVYKKKNIHIYISTFGKQKIIKVKNAQVIEVGGGKIANKNNFHNSLRDDSGINISSENEFFGELTGLYWIWKNISFQENDLIGFAHYNKALHVSLFEILKFFNSNGNHKWCALEEHYNRDHPRPNELMAIKKILKTKYPEYYKIWNEIYASDGSGNSCRGGQLFITSRDEFQKYCEFLFDVLFELKKDLDTQFGSSDGVYRDADKSMRRYCAFMGERLLNVYLRTNNCDVKGCKMRCYWHINIARKIIKTFKINRNTKVYKILKNKFGYKSSYKRI